MKIDQPINKSKSSTSSTRHPQHFVTSTIKEFIEALLKLEAKIINTKEPLKNVQIRGVHT